MSLSWNYNQFPKKTNNGSIIIAYIEEMGIRQIELGESDGQYAERHEYDGNYGDAGLSWLVDGVPEIPVDHDISAWIEITPPKLD